MALLAMAFGEVSKSAAVEKPEAFLAALIKMKTLPDGMDGAPVKPLFESEALTSDSPAEQVTVDLRGCRRFCLVATGPKGIGMAHAIWGDPVLVDAAGRKTPIAKLKAKSSKVGWFKLETGSFDGKPIATGDRVFPSGLFAHADSYIEYTLDQEYVELVTWIGLNNSSRGGVVKFSVTREAPPISRVVDVEKSFPRSLKRLKDLLGKDFEKWVVAQDPTYERKIVEQIAGGLGAQAGNLLSRSATLAKSTAYVPADWLSLMVAAMDRQVSVGSLKEDLAVTRKVIETFASSKARPSALTAMSALEAGAAAALQGEDGMREAFVRKVADLRRTALFSHPSLQFDDLLFNKRQPPLFSHNSDQYLARHSRVSPGLVLLKNWKSEAPEQVYLTREKLPTGSILHPDLSYDGKRVIFSFADHRQTVKEQRAFQIWEAAVDGSRVRQVTGTERDPRELVDNRKTFIVEDFDPCYLPDGDFIFTSTRGQNVARCHAGRYNPSALLYRGKLDGSGIRQVTFGEANEIDPAVLNDGRVVYNRWEYINRHDCKFHALWSIFPDGARTANYYKNLTTDPLSVAEPRAIPGSDKIMATATAHHSFTAGTILLIDPAKGDEGETPLTHLTPEVAYPESQGMPDSTYAQPFPIAENLFFAAYSDRKHVGQGQVQVDNAYRICLVYHLDGKAWREDIVSDPDISCMEPLPLLPREKPPVVPTTVKAGAKMDGTMYVQNVYESTQPIPPHSIAWLRLNEIFNQPTPRVPHRSWVMDEVPKAVLGLVKVEPDGSAFFKVPAGRPFQIQALDSNKMAIMTMRSFVYSHPGENQSCVGCHENRTGAPSTRMVPTAKEARDLVPWVGSPQQGGFNYVAQVQPILDRHCISCHGLDGQEKGGVNLLGEYIEKDTGRYPNGKIRMPKSYWAFFSRPGFIKMADRNAESPYSKPKDYFAHAGKLAPFLMAGHQGVTLPSGDMERVITWLDLNGQLYGNFSWNRPENRVADKKGEETLRDLVRQHYGSRMADEPYSALVNNGLLSESRALKLGLAVGAGGWAQGRPLWTGTNDPGYREMRTAVESSLEPLPFRDIDGTCGRGLAKCICGSCWVRELSAR